MDTTADSHQMPTNLGPQQQGILDQTLGEVLKNNPQAQSMVMQAMRIGPDQFQKLLGMTGNNQLMNTKIRDLFSSGVVQQALAQQGQPNPAVVAVSPDQLTQTTNTSTQQVPAAPVTPAPTEQKKSSFTDKLKSLFKIM